MQSKATADRNDLIVGVRRDHEDALLLDVAKLRRHAVRDTMDSTKKARGGALKHIVQKLRALHGSSFPECAHSNGG
jgi:hypothetical protein